MLRNCVFLIIVGWGACLHRVEASFQKCETIDGDCLPCKHPWLTGNNAVAEVHLSGESALVRSATYAEGILKNISSGQIQRFDNPTTGLHTSLFYFCCHSKRDITTIKNVLQDMQWTSFVINYDTFGCNLDHDKQTVSFNPQVDSLILSPLF